MRKRVVVAILIEVVVLPRLENDNVRTTQLPPLLLLLAPLLLPNDLQGVSSVSMPTFTGEDQNIMMMMIIVLILLTLLMLPRNLQNESHLTMMPITTMMVMMIIII